MGQGSDSCGGWEVDYDPHEEGLETGWWTQRDGTAIHVNKMTVTHLLNARRLCLKLFYRSSFTCERNKWQSWVNVFNEALGERRQEARNKVTVSKRKPSRGVQLQMKCHCGKLYIARKADVDRQWGLSCSKSCAATRKTYKKPAATVVKRVN